MKFGMNLLLWTTEVSSEHDSVLEALAGMGFQSVEIPVFNLDNLAPYERLGRKLKELGLSATAVTVMTPEANPISLDAGVRKAAVERLEKVLQCCSAFNAEILCGPTHSAIGVFSGEGPTETEFKHGVETMTLAAERARVHGIMLGIEYLNRFENYFLTTAADTAKFVRAVNHPYLKMMYDSFHAHIEEKNQGKAIQSCSAETIHVHVSENDRGIPGTGQVDWPSFFGAIKQTGFDGCLTIEAFGRALPALAAATRVWRDLFPDPLGLCKDGLAFIKKNVGAS